MTRPLEKRTKTVLPPKCMDPIGVPRSSSAPTVTFATSNRTEPTQVAPIPTYATKPKRGPASMITITRSFRNA
eukprot:CAMPEP_0176427966 /NCGR_PEP_ID=MMETSP0127-20121128/12881_1 /TAXON_ID=938130 /ORGANISM="Platyophrya macrostoma, Strain WH" /LENGTH=72 /DNA_ID=CAMNT_0017809583 /DNA_START=64 /DNA_END=278 /DNA_ORIENTATION=-